MTPIGANAWVVWKGTDPEDYEYWYISFGEYDDETGCDSFGIADYHIAYYADDEEDLKKMMSQESWHDFYVLHYELMFRSDV